MSRRPSPAPTRFGGHARAFAIALLLACVPVVALAAAITGKIQGRLVATDTGEPIGFADVLLLPADSTMAKVGGLSNADGTFLLEAAPGRYTLQIRALSYARKRVEGVALEAGKMLPFSTALVSEAIQQEEIVVEGKARQNSETSMLAARKRAASVGDAISAEQVRKSPDKDAAEVLRRVTGLSVSDGKYVFVRGLGERYSSVEVDGVRIASPEQNKRVVPLDLVPANLLENIVVQKTHTADRPGEFGGGDVQVHTKDFPGKRTWSFSTSQGYNDDATFKDRLTYRSTRADIFGFGADSRKIPGAVSDLAGNSPLRRGDFSQRALAGVAKAFSDVWSPSSERTIPNAGYSATYGDEFKLFGRPLGLIESWSLSRSFDREDLSHRYLLNSVTDTTYDYAVTRYQETAQLGGLSGLSYRLSPRHSLHLRGLYTNSADDEVRIYEGPDHNYTDATERYKVHHNTRLMYVQRNVLSGTLEGKHEFSSLHGTSFDWKVTRSQARRLQPDKREVTYDRNFYPDADGNYVEYWALGSNGIREFGDLKDNGWGTTLSAAKPVRLGPLGNGKLVLGYDRQTKKRTNSYRRFNFYPWGGPDRRTMPPDSIFNYANSADTVGYVEENTQEIDNYRADQRVNAGYLSADVPFGTRVRGNVGVRVESALQDVRAFYVTAPDDIAKRGTLDDTDWLPSANLTWAMTDALNLRMGASRTVSRPDLNELSPSPALEYVGGFRVAGNPDLNRALIDNYDVRLEAFPALSEVLAAGFFYKKLREPIEQAIEGGTTPRLVPRNSDRGRNLGVELEARSGLGRLWRGLKGLSVNANASFISSAIHLKPSVSRLGTTEHPLQGQADYLVNVTLGYATPGGGLDMAVLLSATGKRLRTLAYDPLPDIYDQPATSLDATMSFLPISNARVKVAAKNLLDPRIRQTQGPAEVWGTRFGRGYSIALSYGS